MCLYLEDGAGFADGNKPHLNASASIDTNHTLDSAQPRELLNCNNMNSHIIKRSTDTFTLWLDLFSFYEEFLEYILQYNIKEIRMLGYITKITFFI